MPTPSRPEGDQDRWREILHAVTLIQTWTAGIGEKAYLEDERTMAAVAMHLVAIGETAGRMSSETKATVALPWAQIAALRNRIAHGYGGVDHRRIWTVVTSELPTLAEAARRALAEER